MQTVEEAEFLKNIVRLRYIEEPRNLEVSAIAAQYELGGRADAIPAKSTDAFASLTGSVRPTVSLTPQDDGASVRQFLTPISADTLVFLAQSGWPVGPLLQVWAERLNGVPNWVPASGPGRDKPTDFARFRRATTLLQSAQDRELLALSTDERTTELSGPLPAESVTAAAAVEAARAGFEFRPRADGGGWAVVRRDRRLTLVVTGPGRTSPELAELCAVLNMRPGADYYRLEVAAGVPDPALNPAPPADVIRIQPRSTAQALFFLANGVEVPPGHIACGLVRLPADGTDPSEATRGVFRVRSCGGRRGHPPAGAYAAVWYRDHWFYIEDGDLESKSTLLLMLQLKRLDFRRQEIARVPTLTLPVGR